MPTELDLAYSHCQRVARKQARNFYYAFRTLPRAERRAIYATYAFCRHCDDIADDDLPLEAKRERLAGTRALLRQADAGRPQGPVFAALRHASVTYDIPARYFHDIVDGVEMDLTRSRFATFDDLRVYCYKVAAVVGLICIEVFGYEDPRARDYAVDLGLAMQLTNILRDLREDADRGRIYLPQDELDRFGYSEDELRQGVINDPFLRLMRFQAERARGYFASGRRLLPLLPARSRACPAVLGGIYGALLDRIEASGFDVFSHRVGLSSRKKLYLTARLWAQSLLPAQPTAAR